MRTIAVLLSALIASAIRQSDSTASVAVKPAMPDDKKNEMMAMLALAGRLMKLAELAKNAKTLKESTQPISK